MARNYEDIDRIVQSCLEAIESGEESIDSIVARYPNLEESIRPPLEAAAWLERIKPQLDPTPEFIASSRKRLIAQIQHGNVAPQAPEGFSLREFLAGLGPRQLAFQFALALLLVVFLIVGTWGVVMTAQYALPGESLYNVKLAQERVRLAFSFTEIGDARLHAQFAQERLAEVQLLVLENRFEYVDETIARYEQEVLRAIELTRQVAEEDGPPAVNLVNQMDEALTSQQIVLSALSERVPAEIEDEITSALNLTDEGITALEVIRNRLPEIAPPTITPTPTPTRTPTLRPLTTTPSLGDTDPPPASGGETPTGTSEPAIQDTSSPSATPAPPQEPQPSDDEPDETPEPTEEEPKPPNTRRPSPRPTNTHRPTEAGDD